MEIKDVSTESQVILWNHEILELIVINYKQVMTIIAKIRWG